MDIKLNNPIELLSLSLLGLGFTVMYTRMDVRRHIDLEVNLVIWSWSWTWVLGGKHGE